MPHSAQGALIWAVLRGRDPAVERSRSELPDGRVLQMGNRSVSTQLLRGRARLGAQGHLLARINHSRANEEANFNLLVPDPLTGLTNRR